MASPSQPRTSRRAPVPRLGVVALVALLVAGLGTLAACTRSLPPPGPSGPDGRSMTLADSVEPASLNPLAGYAPAGAAKLFDGLVEHNADGSLRPALASSQPIPSADGLSWTVSLRTGVTFTDGSPFGPEDVLATYRALTDPVTASPLATSFDMLAGVRQVDAGTVRFDLTHSYAPFPQLLVLGILPRAALAQPGPAAASPVGVKPVGTGPYHLTEWRRGEKMVLAATKGYFGGEPAIRTVTILFVPDDATRARRLKAGELDGAVLPTGQLSEFEKLGGYRVIDHRSADFRAVELPSRNPVTADRVIRLALNYAVDRRAVVSGPLSGRGSPAFTPIPTALPEFAEPGLPLRFDRAEADRLLDQEGWVRAADGIRVKDGLPARFTLTYPLGDTVRKNLAGAFSVAARAIGVEVIPEGLRWEDVAPRLATDALLLGGGSPFDPDFTAYPLLHSTSPVDVEHNPGGYADAQVDAALDAGRRTADPAQRTAIYRQFQRAYAANPGLVFLAFVDHGYVLRDLWTGYQEVVDSHQHDITWGPWWNLATWTPRK